MKQKTKTRKADYRPPPPLLSQGVAFNVNIKMSMDDLTKLSPQQRTAVLHGIAQVVAASPHR